ncbi:VOC family protein [Streptomyces sp. B1I3]|uniref:VOC family protein n=1 Tax=Streptomyces sp. B1I3 TaxID=3042264 RepID=UPI00278B79BB|nr:VOC family protein [Streptomyces sp. B1I3]MDQ0796550.1 putative enzyme related to lactoylglutathione lyase [Streptomyces sp. B1I3]
MAAESEGTPCWADGTFGDLEGAKRFYGEVLGWTYGESMPEYGNYTQAHVDGKAVAALSPPMPGQETPPAWTLYLSSPDADATTAKIREHGGEVLVEPMRVGDFGTMVLAADPAGAPFGVWQAGSHEGFQARTVPGAYTWAEVFTRDPAKADAFFAAVFGYGVKRLEDEAIDFSLYDLGADPVLGRMKMGEEFPPEVPAHLNVYFTVADCDAAVEKAKSLGAELRFGPMTIPFGRFASLTDPQGAVFSVIDVTTTAGEMPKVTAVS